MDDEKANAIKREYEDRIKNELGIELDDLFYHITMEEKIDNLANAETDFENMIESLPDNSCSIRIPSFQVNGFIQGPYANLLIRSINSYTPDLFRLCWLSPVTGGIPYICPQLVLNKIRTISFIQGIIDIDILKAFIYFGFSSNINTNYGVTVKYPMNNTFYRNLASYMKSINTNLYQENIDNFTDFTGYFYDKYPPYTLFAQLVNFVETINKAHNYSSVGNTICPYVIPWEATFSCVGTQIFNINQSGYQFNITLLNNVYALYYNWLGTRSDLGYGQFGSIGGGTLLSGLISQYYEIFFKVLAATSQVFEDIVIEFSYKITKKCYAKRPYMTQIYYDKCVELYKIYEDNKRRLI